MKKIFDSFEEKFTSQLNFKTDSTIDIKPRE